MTERTHVGETRVVATISAPGPSGEGIRLELVVDSGAQYTLLPERVWRSLGLHRTRTLTFQLADSSEMERGISEAHIELPEIDGERLAAHTTVILGERSDPALLGVVTLETFGLVLDPNERALHKARTLPLLKVA